MLRTTAGLVAFTAILCLAAVGWASARRIALLKPDSELERAVSLALAPWGLETISSDVPVPESSQPEAVQLASNLARRLEVEALVWVTRIRDGSLLWVFDARTGDVTTRQLTQVPPFDSAAAAAVALSVKTVLRASFVAPPEERFGVQSALPPAEVASHAQSTVASAENSMALEVGAGGYWLGEPGFDPRFEVAGALWIPKARSLGLSLELSSGSGIRIDTPAYEGYYRELVVGAKSRFRALHLPSVSAIIALGGAVHRATLEGTLTADSYDRNVKRLNGSVDLEVLIHLRVNSAVYLGVSGGAGYFPRYRRYLVEGTAVFAPWPVTVSLTGYCGVELF